MIVLGLLLLLFAVGATAVAVTAPVAPAQVIEMTTLGFKVSASPLTMFLAGAASVVLFGLGIALVSRGARRRSRARKELRGLRKNQAPQATEVSADTEKGSSADTGKRSSADGGESYSGRHGPVDSTATDTSPTSNQDNKG